MADGELREVDPYAAQGAHTGRWTPSRRRRGWLPSRSSVARAPANAGTHTWLIRARVNVKQTLDTTDPNPFFAKVDRFETITC